jgi:hypothetical protein
MELVKFKSGGLNSAAALGVNRPCACASSGQRQEAAGKAEVLEHHDLLHLISAAVENKTGEYAERRKRDSCVFGLEADEDRNACDNFEDCSRPSEGSSGRQADGCDVTGSSFNAAKLLKSGGDEHGGKQDAAEEREKSV